MACHLCLFFKKKKYYFNIFLSKNYLKIIYSQTPCLQSYSFLKSYFVILRHSLSITIISNFMILVLSSVGWEIAVCYVIFFSALGTPLVGMHDACPPF
jgi:hypothetical protein